MRAFLAFFKKEWLEQIRSGRQAILFLLFFLFGMMNPAIAKLTPWMMELMAESLEESGFLLTTVYVDALTSWTQFFKNVPMALIIFILLHSGSFTKEYQTGTLVLVLTKGLDRYKVVLAKALTMLLLWTAGFWLCYGVTYAYNACFWDNAIAENLLFASACWWLFGIFVLALLVLFSSLARSNVGVLLGTGGSVLAAYLMSLLPRAGAFSPTVLMGGADLLSGAADLEECGKGACVSLLLIILCLAISIPVVNRKQI